MASVKDPRKHAFLAKPHDNATHTPLSLLPFKELAATISCFSLMTTPPMLRLLEGPFYTIT